MSERNISSTPRLQLNAFRDILPEFETRQHARARRDLLVRVLAALGGQAPAADKLRCTLLGCKKLKRCRSAICPVCVRTLRRRFIKAVLKLVPRFMRQSQIADDRIIAFSAVLPEEQYPVGLLHQADLRRINERLQRRHLRLGLPMVFAGVDVSFNEDSAGRWAPYWQLQVYGIVVGLTQEVVKERLAQLHPATDRVCRPLRSRVCKELPDALSYTIKPMFVRRVSYLDRSGRHNTRKVGLKSSQLGELAAWLGQYPVTVRYILTGCRKSGDRIVLCSPLQEKHENR